MVKLKRLKIDKFRNVAPGTELHFRDSRNVLLGKNATGKTTLLNLIVAVLGGRFETFRDEAFELEYELKAPQGDVTIHLRNRLIESKFSPIESKFSPSDGPLMSYAPEDLVMGEGDRFWASCEVQFQLGDKPRKYLLKVEGTDWVLQEGSTELRRTPLGSPLLDGYFMGEMMMWFQAWSKRNPQLLSMSELATLMLELRSQGLSHLQRFDESLIYLDELTRSKSLFESFQVGGARWILASEYRSNSIRQHLRGRLEANPSEDRLLLRDSDPEMDFLARVVHLLNFASGEVRLQRTARNAGPPERIEFGDLQFYFGRKDGSEIDGSRLSYGQKRLLSFYYYLDCSAACVVADELVNGMHHEWIEACLEDLGERQAFLTSQNPLLLDFLGFETAEEVRSSFVLCSSDLQGESEQLRWENMSPEDSEGFFQAYQVGIQHVSEILRTRGLW